MKNKEIYRDFCQDNSSLWLFSQPWWLDAAAGAGNWDVALVLRGNQVAAALPYSRKRLAGFRAYKMPELPPWYHILWNGDKQSGQYSIVSDTDAMYFGFCNNLHRALLTLEKAFADTVLHGRMSLVFKLWVNR